MIYKRFGNTVVVRIDRGEEILEQMQKACLAEHVTAAAVSAIGATDDFTVGLFSLEDKKYYKNRFTGSFEIVSLLGNITTMHGEYYAHLHLTAADGEGRTYGGHLDRAVVSATCEMIITEIDGTVERFRDEKSGLNLIKL